MYTMKTIRKRAGEGRAHGLPHHAWSPSVDISLYGSSALKLAFNDLADFYRRPLPAASRGCLVLEKFQSWAAFFFPESCVELLIVRWACDHESDKHPSMCLHRDALNLLIECKSDEQHSIESWLCTLVQTSESANECKVMSFPAEIRERRDLDTCACNLTKRSYTTRNSGSSPSLMTGVLPLALLRFNLLANLVA